MNSVNIIYIIKTRSLLPAEKRTEGSEKDASSKSGRNKDSAQSTTSEQATSPGGGMFTSPGLQSIMQQMIENPQLVQEMFNAPYMKSMVEALAANPEVASQVI